MSFFLRKRYFFGTLVLIFILYFALVGYWTGYYTKRKIINDIYRSVGLQVSIGYSHIYPFTGNGTLRNIRIHNPPGFLSPSVFTIAEINFTGNTRSLYSDEIELESIQIREPTLIVEAKGGATNLATLAQKARETYVRFARPSHRGFKRIRSQNLGIGEFVIQLGPKILNREPPILKLQNIDMEGVVGDQGGGELLSRLGTKIARIYLDDAQTQLRSPTGVSQEVAQKLLEYIEIARAYMDAYGI